MRWSDRYLERVAGQIRVKRIRGTLTAELREHMELQKADHMKSGLSESEAERRATLDMGDPLLVGGALDAAHRPRPQWKGLLIALLLLLAGLGIQAWCGLLSGVSLAHTLSRNRAFFTLSAIVTMCLFACTDYTLWTRLSPLALGGWLLLTAHRMWMWIAIGENLCLPLLSYGHAMLMVDAILVGAMLSVLRAERLPEESPSRGSRDAALG